MTDTHRPERLFIMPSARGRRCLLGFLVASDVAASAVALRVPPAKRCTIKICHNKDCTKRRGGEMLLTTFRDLLPPDTSEVVVESSGCLSQCGKGPNVCCIDADGKEKLYFGVDDATTASAVLDVATGGDYPINLLVAATSIAEAERTTSPSKKEKLLTNAIKAVSDDRLQSSFAHAHALFLRADAQLDLSPPDIDGAVADAELACKITPREGKAWRVLASAHEASGNFKAAIDALRECARADPSFSTKAKNEIERLANK
ncbi:hypothetical protein ACHAXT_008256 [Thalassiosira profunda]